MDIKQIKKEVLSEIIVHVGSCRMKNICSMCGEIMDVATPFLDCMFCGKRIPKIKRYHIQLCNKCRESLLKKH